MSTRIHGRDQGNQRLGHRIRSAVVGCGVERGLCRNGNAVAFDPIPGVGHGFIAFKASNAAIAWIAERFAGQPAPTSCG